MEHRLGQVKIKLDNKITLSCWNGRTDSRQECVTKNTWAAMPTRLSLSIKKDRTTSSSKQADYSVTRVVFPSCARIM